MSWSPIVATPTCSSGASGRHRSPWPRRSSGDYCPAHSPVKLDNSPSWGGWSRWGETFSNDVVAAAMIDRLVHHAEVLTLTGDSYRTRQRRELLAKDNRASRD